MKFLLQKLINVNFFHSFFFTWRNALKLKQQCIYNKINGRQIVSTVSDCGSFFRIACTQKIALAFNLTSAKCLEVNNRRMKKKKNCWEKLKFIETNRFQYFWWQTCCRWRAKWMTRACESVWVCLGWWKLNLQSGMKYNFITFNTSMSNCQLYRKSVHLKCIMQSEMFENATNTQLANTHCKCNTLS